MTKKKPGPLRPPRPIQFARWRQLKTDAEKCDAVISFMSYYGKGSIADIARMLSLQQEDMADLSRVLSGLIGRGFIRQSRISERPVFHLFYREQLRVSPDEWDKLEQRVRTLLAAYQRQPE